MSNLSTLNAALAVAQAVNSEKRRHRSNMRDARIGGGPVVRCPTCRNSRTYAPGRHRPEEGPARSRKSSEILAHHEARRRGFYLREGA